MGLFIYGIVGLYNGELWFPGSRGSEGLTFSENTLTLILLAIFTGILNLLLPIIDHYDKRDNENVYRFFGRALTAISLFLIIIATSIVHGYI